MNRTEWCDKAYRGSKILSANLKMTGEVDRDVRTSARSVNVDRDMLARLSFIFINYSVYRQ